MSGMGSLSLQAFHYFIGSRLYFDFLHKNQFDRWQSFDGVHVVAKVIGV
jgi:hypothetical protein